MAKPVRMHVARTPSKYVDKAGNVHRYESVLVRRTFRDGKKVRHETLANLSKLPAEVIAAIEATLKGQTLVAAAAAIQHHPVAAARACRGGGGDGAHAGVAGPAGAGVPVAGSGAGVDHLAGDPTGSKLSTLSRWSDSTLGADLGVAGASTDEIYAAMDWLAGRQDAIETRLAAKAPGARGESSADGVV